GIEISSKVISELKQIESSGNIAVNIISTPEGKAVVVLSVKEGVKFKVKTVKEALNDISAREAIEVIVDISSLSRSEIKQVEAEVVRIISLNKDEQITLISETQGEIAVRMFNNENIKGELCRLPENVVNNLKLDIENDNYKQGLGDVVDIVSNQGRGINRPVDITINYAKSLESRGLIVNPINPGKGVLAVTTKGEGFDLVAMKNVLTVPARDIIVDLSNIKSNRQRQIVQEMIVEARKNDINKQITLIDTSIKGREGIIDSNNGNIKELKINPNSQKAEAFIREVRDGLEMRKIALMLEDRVIVAKTTALPGTISPKTPGVINDAFTSLRDLKSLLLPDTSMNVLKVKGKISTVKVKGAIATMDPIRIGKSELQSLVKTVVLNRRARNTVLGEEQMRVIAVSGEILAKKLPVERQSEALQMARNIDISQNTANFPHLKEVAETMGMRAIILKDTASTKKQLKQIRREIESRSIEEPIVVTINSKERDISQKINVLKSRLDQRGYMDKSFEGGLVVTNNPIVISSNVKNVGLDFMNALQENINIAADKGFKVSKVQVKVISKKGFSQRAVMNALKKDLGRAGMEIIHRFSDKNMVIVSKINEQTMANLVQNKGGIKVADAQPPKIPDDLIVSLTPKGITNSKGPKDVYIPGLPNIKGITAMIGSN
ncbi:hypothetical protein KAU39_07475, partial [bacterium]|nr:hypothetical protein [bacterium]